MSDIKTQVFNAYQEYIASGYSRDPNIYVLRACPETISDLILVSVEYQVMAPPHPWKPDPDGVDRFLLFRLQPDTRLPKGDIIFGPETIDIKWSK